MANRFVLNETSYHGKGAIQAIVTEAKARGFKKALVCSDPDLIKFGVTKKVTKFSAAEHFYSQFVIDYFLSSSTTSYSASIGPFLLSPCGLEASGSGDAAPAPAAPAA